jgi:PEGA domain
MEQSSCRNKNFILAFLASMLLAGIPAAMAADGTTGLSSPGSNISVITNPSGAAVYLNGEYRGLTPQRIEYLSPGTYVVDIRMNGYRNETVQRTLNGTMLEIGINLESLSSLPAPTGNGSVAIDSNPGGASVLLDGKSAGSTPAGRAALILNDVPAGNHSVTVELAGYAAYTTDITVMKNKVVQVNADFATRTPTISGTPIATTDRSGRLPLSPLAAVAAACLAGLAATSRRS